MILHDEAVDSKFSSELVLQCVVVYLHAPMRHHSTMLGWKLNLSFICPFLGDKKAFVFKDFTEVSYVAPNE